MYLVFNVILCDSAWICLETTEQCG